MKPIIEVRHVEKRYKKKGEMALRGIDSTVNEGEFFGLLGPNAAGKSTLINLLCGIIKTTTGEIAIDGFNVEKNIGKIKQYIGLVPQELALFPKLTVKENLYFFASMHGLFGKKLKERIAECIAMTSLEASFKKRISECSGGIQRRANLACGIVHKPRILILDEPTVGVDMQSRMLIFENLKKLNSENITIVYTTHYMEEAETLCSNIAIIDRGSIIACGTPVSLIKAHEDCRNLGDVFLKLTKRELRD